MPFLIREPGRYRLTANLTTTEDGIVILADDVTIDGCGFSIQHQGGPDTTHNGIHSHVGRSRISVSNLVVQDFFQNLAFREDYEKLAADDAQSAAKIQVSNVLSRRAKFRGIRLDARDSVVRDCVILDTGGSTFFDDAFAIGVEAYGARNQIQSNLIRSIHSVGKGEAVGVSISDFGADFAIVGNTIRNPMPSGQPNFGIWIGGASHGILMDNRIENVHHGLVFSSTCCGACPDNQFHNCHLPLVVKGSNVLTGTYTETSEPAFQSDWKELNVSSHQAWRFCHAALARRSEFAPLTSLNRPIEPSSSAGLPRSYRSDFTSSSQPKRSETQFRR